MTRSGLAPAPRRAAEEESEADWIALAWGGVLAGGDSARLGGMAAAHLYGLGDERPYRLLIHVERSVRRTSRDRWQFRRELPGKAVRPPRGAPPRISVEDLVLDLIDSDSDDTARRGAVHWITVAVQRRLTTSSRLRRAVESRSRLRERDLVLDLLTDVGGGVESPLELRYLNDVERAHGLPRGRRQSVRRAARFERTVRAFRDVFYDEFGLLVELDGRAGHVDEGRLRDLRRDNVSTLRGERTLRYGWTDVSTEPCLTAFQVAGCLRNGGWQGLPTRCSRCRNLPDRDIWELDAG